MNKLVITDSSSYSEHFLFDYFYPSPLVCQDLNRELFETIFGKKVNFYSAKGLFQTTVNRYFLTDIKVMEHPLILKNILQYCKENGVDQLELLVSEKNRRMSDFYVKNLIKQNVNVHVNFHTNKVYWKNSLTQTVGNFKKKLKIAVTVLAQFTMLLLNYLFKKVNWNKKKVLLWNSFANNRQKIDYIFLDKLEQNKELIVVHPNPYLLKSKTNWNKSIYWLGEYSMPPGKFLKVVFSMLPFRKKFNLALEEYKDTIQYTPEDWNIDVLQKTFYFFIYNLLMGYLMEKTAENKDIKIFNVFRGGSAAGLIYSGICKQKNNPPNYTSILLPHGTEFNPIDHFSYFYLDYNILPSQKITENWEDILSKKYGQLLRYSMCKNVAGGRIDYAFLQKEVNTEKRNLRGNKKYRIGIVLTYNSESYQQAYIASILNLFSSVFTEDIEFVVKPRPNLPYVPNEELSKATNLIIDKGDIFPFLNSIDMVVGTVSVYGVLTMVVTDGILCDIPGFYYFPNKSFSIEDLGYSYHSSMNNYCFPKEIDLKKFISGFTTFDEFIDAINQANSQTKDMLVYNGDPYGYLQEMILEKLD